MKKILPLYFTLLFVYSAYAQDISGVVFNEDTREPVGGALVFLEQDSLLVLSDNNGKFTIPYKGEYPVSFSVDHYFYSVKDIQLGRAIDDFQIGMFTNNSDSASVNAQDPLIEYNGCDGELNGLKCFLYTGYKYIKREFKYPEVSKQMGYSDKVVVTWKYTRERKIEIMSVSGRYADLNAEAKRLIQGAPIKRQFKYRGYPVDCIIRTPINFRLQ